MLRKPVHVRNLGKLLNLLNISKFTVVRNNTKVRMWEVLKLPSSLVWHRQIHNGEKPSEGEVCGKHLDVLQPILNIREFILERNSVNAHGKAFRHSLSFIKHPRIHSCEKPCEIRDVGMHLVWVSTFLKIKHMY